MNIVADENIPFAEKLFSNLGKVILAPGRTLSNADLNEADILLTRSVTQVNSSLLSGTRVQFVGTCTIGTDHIDKNYLSQSKINFASAPGCNAFGVVQYDICALAYLGKLDKKLKYAVVGCGNVGGRVYRALKEMGFDCIGVDPNLDCSIIPDLAPFEDIFECDVICMHTPLIRGSHYPTESLIGAKELAQLKAGAILLNAGRGECIDNVALLEHMKSDTNLRLVLDVWAHEPNINAELFEFVEIGTPHIAGYSYEGRVNGSIMIFESLALHLGKSRDWIVEKIDELKREVYGTPVDLDAASINDLVLSTYDIKKDHDNLSAALNELPASFDALRKFYFKRREFSHYKSLNHNLNTLVSSALGFMA